MIRKNPFPSTEKARIETLKMFGIYSPPKKTLFEKLAERERADNFNVDAAIEELEKQLLHNTLDNQLSTKNTTEKKKIKV